MVPCMWYMPYIIWYDCTIIHRIEHLYQLNICSEEALLSVSLALDGRQIRPLSQEPRTNSSSRSWEHRFASGSISNGCRAWQLQHPTPNYCTLLICDWYWSQCAAALWGDSLPGSLLGGDPPQVWHTLTPQDMSARISQFSSKHRFNKWR